MSTSHFGLCCMLIFIYLFMISLIIFETPCSSNVVSDCHVQGFFAIPTGNRSLAKLNE